MFQQQLPISLSIKREGDMWGGEEGDIIMIIVEEEHISVGNEGCGAIRGECGGGDDLMFSALRDCGVHGQVGVVWGW